MSLSSHKRIKKSETINDLFTQGEKYGSRFFYVSFTRQETTAVAFIAGKKVGGAVLRNRCKRRLREAYRLSSPNNLAIHMVLVARPQLLKGTLPQVCKELSRFYRYLQERVC